MLRGRAIVAGAIAAALLLALAAPAWAQIDNEKEPYGSACSGTNNGADWDTIFECNGSTWQRGPYFFGATSDTCDSNHAGMVQWTGGSVSPNNTFEFCNGSNWITVNGVAGSVALNGIAAATGSAAIDSGANAITWAWNSLSAGTGLTISTSAALTGGTLMSLQATAASATSTGYVLSISDSTTGTGYGVYSSMTATANTGYAIYATNTGAGYALGVTGTSTFNGNVGIGTTTPAYPLQVTGNAAVNGTLYFANNDNGVYINGYGNPSDAIYLHSGFMGSSSYLMVVDSDGNPALYAYGGYLVLGTEGGLYTYFTGSGVGIGVTSPDAALAVAGHIDTHQADPGSLTGGCGAAATIVGTDTALQITTSGTGLSTTCGATFNANWQNAPICIAQRYNANVVTYLSSVTTSAFVVTSASAFTAGAKFSVHCQGYE